MIYTLSTNGKYQYHKRPQSEIIKTNLPQSAELDTVSTLAKGLSNTGMDCQVMFSMIHR